MFHDLRLILKRFTIMPEEIFSIEEFNALLPSAVEVRRKIKSDKDVVKLKIRTKKKLYTYKVSAKDSERIWNAIKIEKRDV